MQTETESFVEKIRELSKQGFSMSQIAKSLSRSKYFVSRQMTLHSIPKMKRGAQHGRRRIAIKIDEDRMIELYQQGYPCKKIAEILEVKAKNPTEIVRRRLAVLNVPRRIGKAVGKENPQWKGGRNYDSSSNRYLCYKIVVRFLGMLLPSGWVIHHLDENPLNNDLSNLALFPSDSIHAKYHQWLLASSLSGTEEEAIQRVLEIGGHLLLSPSSHCESVPDKGLLSLLKTEGKKLGFRTKWKEALNCQDRRLERRVS